MINNILNIFGIKRKIKEKNSKKMFDDFYKSDINNSEMILEELKSIIKKVLKTGVMQELNGNSYSLEIYTDKIIIINNNTYKIGKYNFNNFIEKIKEKTK